MGIGKHLAHLLNTSFFINVNHFLISILGRKHYYFTGKLDSISLPLHFLLIILMFQEKVFKFKYDYHNYV